MEELIIVFNCNSRISLLFLLVTSEAARAQHTIQAEYLQTEICLSWWIFYRLSGYFHTVVSFLDTITHSIIAYKEIY